MSIFLAKDYASRANLESAVRAEAGTDVSANRTAGHTIEGTREELLPLGLDDTVTVFGVKVVVTTPKADKTAERAKRK